MIRFAEVWPDQAQVTALAQHLGWSHFKEILYLEARNYNRIIFSEFTPRRALRASTISLAELTMPR